MSREELYYQKLLNTHKKLMIFDCGTYYGLDTLEDIINSTKTDKRPIIVMSRYSKVVKQRAESDRLIIMYPKYSDIESLKGVDNSNKIIIFRGGENNYNHTEFTFNLELAMTANNIMTRQGENPLIIIENFQELFDVDEEGAAYNYFVEVILNELSDSQNLVLISWTVFPYGQDCDEPSDFFRVVREMDAMAFAQNFISNSYTGPIHSVIGQILSILKSFNGDMTDILENFKKICVDDIRKDCREICVDEMRLKKGLVFDFKAKTVEDFGRGPN